MLRVAGISGAWRETTRLFWSSSGSALLLGLGRREIGIVDQHAAAERGEQRAEVPTDEAVADQSNRLFIEGLTGRF
jgi:hypothetical protein